MKKQKEILIRQKSNGTKPDVKSSLPIDKRAVYKIRKDAFDYPIAITIMGKDIIHLNPSERTCDNIEMLIGELNRQ